MGVRVVETQRHTTCCANPVCGHNQDGEQGHEGGIGKCLVCSYCMSFMPHQELPKILFTVNVE